MKLLQQLFIVLFLVVAALAANAPAPDSALPPGAVLPAEFGGWQQKGDVAKSDDPATADAANGAILKEYGFVRLEKAAYTRDDGRNLTLKAAVFEDASGAYGAFTFYHSDEMGAGADRRAGGVPE